MSDIQAIDFSVEGLSEEVASYMFPLDSAPGPVLPLDINGAASDLSSVCPEVVYT